MHIQRVVLNNFRNITDAKIELVGGINVFYGNNAQGKTNFLESVYFCATGRSHRFGRDKELIKIGEKMAFASVFINNNGLDDKIAVQVEKDSKKIAVNGTVIKRLGELFGNLVCVIFSPEDLSLVKAGPGLRRRFLDMELCQLYPAYYFNLRMYYKVLKQRNNLLREISANPKLLDTLEIWDEQLVKFGKDIITTRETFVAQLSILADANQKIITDNRESLEIIYKSNVDSDGFLEKLTKNRDFDIARKSTSVGIHKDDLEFKINGRDGRVFASQGQQRTAALSIKLAEIDLIFREKGHMPVLLLDDILSELDNKRQSFLMSKIEGLQTIITMTGAESVFGSFFSNDKKVENARFFKVENGEFFAENP